MIRFFLSLLFLLTPLNGFNILSERLLTAQKGDYLAAALNRTFVLIFVRDVSETTLFFEEVSVPRRLIASIPKWEGWKEWLIQGGKGHSSWNMYTVEKKSGKIIQGYSFTKKFWFRPPPRHNFLATLFSLPLEPIQLSVRARRGKNREEIWQPTLYYEGKKIQGAKFDGWSTHWPKDGSDLSGKKLILYLPSDGESYPSYFPYWLHIDGFLGRAKARVVDSGTKMHSPNKNPPLHRTQNPCIP